MIPAEDNTPQISDREKSSSFDLLFNQATACSSSTPGPVIVDTALSMLPLHCGSLYMVDMDLSEEDRQVNTSNEIIIEYKMVCF